MVVGLRLQDGKPWPCGLCKSPLPRNVYGPRKNATHRDRAMYSISCAGSSIHSFQDDGMMGGCLFHLCHQMDAALGAPRGPQHPAIVMDGSLRLHMFIFAVIRGLWVACHWRCSVAQNSRNSITALSVAMEMKSNLLVKILGNIWGEHQFPGL
ncbi:uncharacterized protein TrAFT101_006800 [Trichoderma asperellum]|uniref:Uncharacterized protein n=1 Tax=Trichoderma asperellum (strain ATCC 204424 / CBS 433.97 / NBRC 101777) TaxID=1042311 RepID=A0A2T3Z1T9_TRIA4|nr:hypothetical protein M441DRAFT_71128 [Trichoderma asperellum CBS 433.97]PTB38772.1 hypothetical protein M441DRAFT_71128 [Trichoderma asperellum CBS 433.97]UKZ91829.1 hypothetical protein TrAFT101_006800 [Trichoderma asperellum]